MGKYKKRADGRYCAQIVTGEYTESGAQKRISVYARTEAELKQKLSEFEYQRKYGALCCDQGTHFGVYARHWLDTSKKNRSIKTQEMYKSVLKHTSKLQYTPLKDIKQSMIQSVINDCADHPRTCEQLRITLNQIFDCAIADGILLKNPCIHIDMPRRVVHEKRALTKAEREAIKTADLDIMHRAFLDILYYTGMRPAEAYALTWSDIDFHEEKISICKSLTFKGESPVVTYPKTNSGVRVVEAPTSLFKTLLSYRGTIKGLILFEGSKGHYMNRSGYLTMWKVCKRKIEDILGYSTNLSAYYLRHNYCTQLYYSNVSLKEAVRLMGHADSTMIMRVYSHLDSERENTKEKINSIAF